MSIRHGRRAFCVGFAGACASLAARSEAWPSRPLRIIVPFPPGGSSDVLARGIAQELARGLNQPVVIENVAGAGGVLGGERAAKSPPDGYTLFMGHVGTLAVNPWLYPKLPYDPVRSFAPVAWIARVPNVLVVHPSVPAATLKELVADLKARPGQLSYGSGGNGSAAHVTMEFLKMQAGVSVLHIPYRGTAPSVTDLLGGQVQLLFTGIPALLPHLRAGRMRALAVSSPKRLALLPQVPTVAESGVPGTRGFDADQWYGLVAPTGTPPDIVVRLNQLVNAALATQEVRARLAGEGAEPTPGTPQALTHLIASDLKRWGDVVKRAGIRAD